MHIETDSLDEIGNLGAAPGSHEWAVAMRREIQSALKEAKTSSEYLQSLLRLMEQHRGYRALDDPRGRKFTTYESFCVCKYPWGLGYRKADIDRIVAERKGREVEERAQDAEPISKAGGVRVGAGRKSAEAAALQAEVAVALPLFGAKPKAKNQVDVINLKTPGGTHADYLTARIARDHPDILVRMKAGEFKSVRAAALEAGIVKPTITVSKEPEAAARVLRKHFRGAALRELIAHLERGDV
jgi:Arc/MetJ-type ribon-helix-helix transcriptional regulator